MKNNTFIYKGVLVLWDEDRDARVLELLNQMERSFGPLKGLLVSVQEHEGSVELRWCPDMEPIPTQYVEGEMVDVLTDSWHINHSQCLIGPVPVFEARIRAALDGLRGLSPSDAPRIVLDSLDNEDLSTLFYTRPAPSPFSAFSAPSSEPLIRMAGEAYDIYKWAKIAGHYVEKSDSTNGHVTGLTREVSDKAWSHFEALELSASAALDEEWIARIKNIAAESRAR